MSGVSSRSAFRWIFRLLFTVCAALSLRADPTPFATPQSWQDTLGVLLAGPPPADAAKTPSSTAEARLDRWLRRTRQTGHESLDELVATVIAELEEHGHRLTRDLPGTERLIARRGRLHGELSAALAAGEPMPDLGARLYALETIPPEPDALVLSVGPSISPDVSGDDAASERVAVSPATPPEFRLTLGEGVARLDKELAALRERRQRTLASLEQLAQAAENDYAAVRNALAHRWAMIADVDLR